MKGEGLKKKDKKRLSCCFKLTASIIIDEQLAEDKQSKEAARAKCSLQVKAQQAYQEWKQKKLETERERRYKERKEMQQRRQAENEVIFCIHKLVH